MAAAIILCLGLLWFLFQHRAIPLMTISAVQPAMHSALIRVAGKVVADTHVSRAAGKISDLRFLVNDGTGELAVTAQAKQAQQMAVWDRVPRAGDLVEVSGVVTVGTENKPALCLRSIEALKLQRAGRAAPQLGGASGMAEGTRLTVSGVVTRVVAPRTGSQAPTVVSLRDGAEERQVVIAPNVLEQVPARDRLAPGLAVRVQATAESHRGKLQLTVEYAQDFEVLAVPPVSPPDKTAPEAKKPDRAPW